jgi:hypothetical protein
MEKARFENHDACCLPMAARTSLEAARDERRLSYADQQLYLEHLHPRLR